MSLVVQCSCGKEYRLSSEFAGKKVKCKKCNSTFVAPQAAAAKVATATAAAPSVEPKKPPVRKPEPALKADAELSPMDDPKDPFYMPPLESSSRVLGPSKPATAPLDSGKKLAGKKTKNDDSELPGGLQALIALVLSIIFMMLAFTGIFLPRGMFFGSLILFAFGLFRGAMWVIGKIQGK